MALTYVSPGDALVARLRDAMPGLRAVYRYGSAGTAYERPDSDIDIAVLADRPLDFPTLAALAGELSLLVGRDVDLNDMRRLPVTLCVQIVTSGERLYAADVAAAEEYDSRVLSDYAYLNELRRGILDDVRARGSIHG